MRWATWKGDLWRILSRYCGSVRSTTCIRCSILAYDFLELFGAVDIGYFSRRHDRLEKGKAAALY